MSILEKTSPCDLSHSLPISFFNQGFLFMHFVNFRVVYKVSLTTYS